MLKLGITGNIASGKTLVENLLRQNGIPVIDADALVHELYEDENVINLIKTLFAGYDIEENGVLSRKKIGKIAFSDEEKLKGLEKILHPEVREKVEKFFLKNISEPIVAASVALLFEAGFEELFDKIIFVEISPKIQLQRLVARNNITENEAKKRIKAQIPQEQKIPRADFVIDNNLTQENTEAQLKKILAELLG